MKKNKDWQKIQQIADRYRYEDDHASIVNVYGVIKGFNEVSEASVELLYQALKLNAKDLDYSLNSLDLLKNAIKKTLLSIGANTFEQLYYFLITIYCGELIRKAVDGEWVMKERKDETFDQILISNKGEPEIIYSPKMFMNSLLMSDTKIGLN
jgi:hypothetical protein